MKKVYVLFFLIFSGLSVATNAQLLQWNTFGNVGTETTEPSVFNDANISAANLTLGAGVTAAGNANRFGGNNWFNTGNTNPNTLAEAITGNDYIQFVVTPNAGYSFTATSFVFIWDRSGTGPANVTLRSSADGYSTDIGTITGITGGAFASNTITISTLSNITAATTFRLYGYGATATTGTGGFDQNAASPGVVNVQLNGFTTLVGGGTPDIVLSSPNPAVISGNIAQGSNNNAIYRFDLAVTTADAILNGVTITTTGTYLAAGINNFKCWYSVDNIFDAGSDIQLAVKTTSLGTGTHVFPSFSPRTIMNGTTGYIFISADVNCSAIVGNTISVNAITTADISFVSGNKSGTAFAGGVQTYTSATPNNVTAPAASVANMSSNLTWTNPAGCYDEVMIVASQGAANSGGAPAGDGSAYAANLNYGAGTAFGNGFVAYKGNTSGQLVTGLTNGTPYFYKFFTRFGTTWSAGIEISETPAVVSSSTDFFRSITSGPWGNASTWQSSADSISWMAATLVPGAAAAHVVIQSPDSVWLTAARTTQNLTIMSGAKMNATTFVMTATNRFNLLGTSSFYQGGAVQSVPGVTGQQVLDVTSNYYFRGTQAGTGTGDYPAFGNLIWEPTPGGSGTFQNAVNAAPFNLGLVVRGNMTINIQGATPREVRFGTGASVSRIHTIDGNLNIEGANSIVVIQNGTIGILSRVTIGGNININGGTLRGVNSSGNGILYVRGNINNIGGIVETGAGSGFFNMNYVGTAAQSIDNTGGTFSFTANQLDTLNNTGAGLTLNTPISHGGVIQFISGLMYTTSTNLLTLNAGSSVIGASNNSFVNGPVSKIGNTDFVFPIGKANSGPGNNINGYAPLQIWNSTGGAATDQYTAEYIRNNPNFNATKVLGLNRVSKCDYWNLQQVAGTSTLNVTLNWQDAVNNCTYASPYVNGANLAALVVAHYNGASWDAFGAPGTATGTQAAGDVTWPNVSTFSPFAIGSIDGLNPLPITVNYFNGTKNNGRHLLNWKVTCVSTPSATMELERSNDGVNFSAVYNLVATAIRCADPFDFTDNQPLAGVNYYRLKMISADGKVSYSSIVTLINASKGIDVMNISPNPIVNGQFNLKVSSAEKTNLQLVITDMQGRVLQQQTVNLAAGFNSIPVTVRNMAAGSYQLFGHTGEDRTRVLRFVVQ